MQTGLLTWRERAKKSLLCDFGCVAVLGQLGFDKSELGVKKGFLDLRSRFADYIALTSVLFFSFGRHFFVSYG